MCGKRKRVTGTRHTSLVSRDSQAGRPPAITASPWPARSRCQGAAKHSGFARASLRGLTPVSTGLSSTSTAADRVASTGAHRSNLRHESIDFLDQVAIENCAHAHVALIINLDSVDGLFGGALLKMRC